MFIKDKLISDASIYALSSFAVSGVPFFLLPIMTRFLTPDDYGIVSMYLMVVAATTIFIGLNAHGSLTVRYFDKSGFDMQEYVSSILLIPFITSFILFFIFLTFGNFISTVTGISQNWLYSCIAVSVGQFIVQVQLALWQAMRRPKIYGILRITHAALDGLISVSLVLLLAMSWTGRLTGVVLSWIIIAAAALLTLKYGRWIIPKFKKELFIDALTFGIPLMPHAFGGLILGMADRLLVTNTLGLNSTGIYNVAAQLGLILGILANAFNQAFAPWLMSSLPNINFKERKKIVIFTYSYCVTILTLAVTLFFIISKFLSVIVGPEFMQVEELLLFILLGNAFTGMYYMVTNYVFYVRKTGYLSVVTITIGIISLIFSWFLIQELGLIGAALGFMSGQALLFFTTWVLASRCFYMPWLLNKEVNN